MPTQILSMLSGGDYPFGQSQQQSEDESIIYQKVIVRQIVDSADWSQGKSFSELIKVARVAKKLSSLSPHLIQIQKTLLFQDQSQIHLIFEYIPIKIQTYISTMDQKFLKKYRSSLYQLADFLSQNMIITNIELKNMGIDKKYQMKYFLGINFEQKKQMNIFELKNDYMEEIKKIFKPYIKSEEVSQVNGNKSYVGKNLVKIENRMRGNQQIQNISSRYLKTSQSPYKGRKHQSIYFQQSRPDGQIKHRKQSYMSSVSNLRLNNLYKRINQIQLQVTNTKSHNKNQFKMAIQGRQITSRSNYQNQATPSIQDSRRGNQISSQSRHKRQQYEQYTHNNSGKKRKISRQYYYQGDNNRQKQVYIQNQLQEPDSPGYRDQCSQIQSYYRKNHKNSEAHSINSKHLSSYNSRNIPGQNNYSGHGISPYLMNSNHSHTLQGFHDIEKPLMSLVANGLRVSGGSSRINKGNKFGTSKKNKKIQLFKQRQYDEIKSTVKGENGDDMAYMKDFMNVLEGDGDQSIRMDSSRQRSIPAITNFEHDHNEQDHSIQAKNGNFKHKQIERFKSVDMQDQFVTSPSNKNLSLKMKNRNIDQSQSNLKSRIQGAIENSKKLIQQFKQKSKRN